MNPIHTVTATAAPATWIAYAFCLQAQMDVLVLPEAKAFV